MMMILISVVKLVLCNGIEFIILGKMKYCNKNE